MTQEQIIKNCENLLDGSAEDPMYQMMLVMMNFIMQMDAERKTGAGKGEHSEERKDCMSGTRKRRENALISMVVEAYTNGVSTRKIKHLAQSQSMALRF